MLAQYLNLVLGYLGETLPDGFKFLEFDGLRVFKVIQGEKVVGRMSYLIKEIGDKIYQQPVEIPQKITVEELKSLIDGKIGEFRKNLESVQ